MNKYYSGERNVQMLVSLMKAHGVRKVVVSPGGTNISVVGSLQRDPYFQLYSSIDERSAAYIACGLAAESGELMALSCTGATASRNYMPGLTEAFYRKLPVLAITSSQPIGRLGQCIAQVTDRRTPPGDTVMESVQIPVIRCKEDVWACNVLMNKALLALKRCGGGPAHINLETTYSNDFSVKTLPDERVINRISYFDDFPDIPKGRVAIFVGSHQKWSKELTDLVDRFCEIYNGVVLCDRTSNYIGKYRIDAAILAYQRHYPILSYSNMDLIIHIGNISGAYVGEFGGQVWRVNPDGEIRDTFGRLRFVFEMEEEAFFRAYVEKASNSEHIPEYFLEWKRERDTLLAKKIPELPFSHVWIAQQMAPNLPENSVLHLGILSALRSWNFFEVSKSVLGYANTGGFGIDGYISSCVGAALADPNKVFFCIAGDLAFYYDLNVLGNRSVGRNIRLLLVNNGCGTEFYNYGTVGARLGNESGPYIAGEGHFGSQSSEVVRHYVQDLGFEYMCAHNKEEFLLNLERFTQAELTERPMFLEVFTDRGDESDAIQIIKHLGVPNFMEELHEHRIK